MENSVKSFLPDKQEIIRLFSIILVISNFLAFLGFAYQFDALIIKFTTLESLLVLSYVLPFAFIESIFILLIISTISLILPKKWLKDQLAYRGTLIYILAIIFLYPWFGFSSSQGISKFYVPVNHTPQKTVFIISWTIICALILYLIRRIFKNQTNREKFLRFLDRFYILSLFYLLIDGLSFMIVFIRGLL